MNYRLRVFAATFVFLVVFSAQLVPRSASAQKQENPAILTQSSFRPDNRANINRYSLYDGDVIMMTVEDDKGIAADQIEIVLKTDPNVTWWKSIILKQQITRPDDSYVGQVTVNSISTQDDDHGPKAMRVRLADASRNRSQLVFAKAKVLGVHTDMYYFADRLGNFNGLNGKRVVFTWQKD
jgi:hypothetical protein